MAEKTEFFRANVGIVLTDCKGHVLAFERADIPGAWQFPQGGLDQGEEPVDTARRELQEETGLKDDKVRFLAEHPRWLTYELPEDARSPKTGRGQAQKWVLFELTGSFDDVDLTSSIEQEFSNVRWMRFDDLLKRVPDFRRPIYTEIAGYFDGLVAGT